jgi:hypothetical protein
MTVWVKLKDLIASGATQFYLFFSDPAYTNHSSESAVLFYSDPSLDILTRWRRYQFGTGNAQNANARMELYSTSPGNEDGSYTVCKTAFPLNIKFRWVVDISAIDYSLRPFLAVAPNPINGWPWNNNLGPDLFYMSDIGSYGGYNAQSFVIKNNVTIDQYSSGIQESGLHAFEMCITNSLQRWKYDNAIKKNHAVSLPWSHVIPGFQFANAWNAACSYYITQLTITEFTPNEPYWGTPGAIEVPIPPTWQVSEGEYGRAHDTFPSYVRVGTWANRRTRRGTCAV